MLILTSKQVEHSQVICMATEPPQLVEAISFQGSFFTKGESFPPQNRSAALKRIQDILEIERSMAMLVEEASQLTVYYLNKQVTSLQENGQTQQQLRSSQTLDPSKTSQSKPSRFTKLKETLEKEIHLFKKK